MGNGISKDHLMYGEIPCCALIKEFTFTGETVTEEIEEVNRL